MLVFKSAIAQSALCRQLRHADMALYIVIVMWVVGLGVVALGIGTSMVRSCVTTGCCLGPGKVSVAAGVVEVAVAGWPGSLVVWKLEEVAAVVVLA